jgi:phage gp36-like protein
MAYVTQAELETLMYSARLVDCADDDGNGTSDAAVVTDILARASAFLDDAAVAAGYTLPLSATGLTPLVREHIGWIAAHLAARRRPQYRDAQGHAPYYQEHLAALAWLKDVRAGTVGLHPTEAPSAQESETTYAVGNTRRRWIR